MAMNISQMDHLEYFWFRYGEPTMPTVFDPYVTSPLPQGWRKAMKKLRQRYPCLSRKSSRIAMNTWIESFMALPDAPEGPRFPGDGAQEAFFGAWNALANPPSEVTKDMWTEWFASHPRHAMICERMMTLKVKEGDAQSY